jgi:hypothetical protein
VLGVRCGLVSFKCLHMVFDSGDVDVLKCSTQRSREGIEFAVYRDGDVVVLVIFHHDYIRLVNLPCGRSFVLIGERLLSSSLFGIA